MRPGIEEIKLYTRATCKNSEADEEVPCRTIEKFEASQIVKINNILISSIKFPSLSSSREQLIRTLVDQLYRYFDANEFADFEFLEPKNLPKEEFAVPSHESVQSVIEIAKKVYIPHETIADEWKNVSLPIHKIYTYICVLYFSTLLSRHSKKLFYRPILNALRTQIH